MTGSSTPSRAPRPSLPGSRTPLQGYRDDVFRRLLSDEYRLLQGKIDKIGGFRFTIKGWCVTAVVAGTITTTGRGLGIALATTLGLLTMLVFFFFLESEQVGYSLFYGERASKLETAFRAVVIGKGEDACRAMPVPGIARERGLSALETKLAKRGLVSVKRPGWWRRMGRLHRTFYVSLVILSLLPLAAQYRHFGGAVSAIRTWSNGEARRKPLPRRELKDNLPELKANTNASRH